MKSLFQRNLYLIIFGLFCTVDLSAKLPRFLAESSAVSQSAKLFLSKVYDFGTIGGINFEKIVRERGAAWLGATNNGEKDKQLSLLRVDLLTAQDSIPQEIKAKNPWFSLPVIQAFEIEGYDPIFGAVPMRTVKKHQGKLMGIGGLVITALLAYLFKDQIKGGVDGLLGKLSGSVKKVAQETLGDSTIRATAADAAASVLETQKVQAAVNGVVNGAFNDALKKPENITAATAAAVSILGAQETKETAANLTSHALQETLKKQETKDAAANLGKEVAQKTLKDPAVQAAATDVMVKGATSVLNDPVVMVKLDEQRAKCAKVASDLADQKLLMIDEMFARRTLAAEEAAMCMLNETKKFKDETFQSGKKMVSDLVDEKLLKMQQMIAQERLETQEVFMRSAIMLEADMSLLVDEKMSKVPDMAAAATTKALNTAFAHPELKATLKKVDELNATVKGVKTSLPGRALRWCFGGKSTPERPQPKDAVQAAQVENMSNTPTPQLGKWELFKGLFSRESNVAAQLPSESSVIATTAGENSLEESSVQLRSSNAQFHIDVAEDPSKPMEEKKGWFSRRWFNAARNKVSVGFAGLKEAVSLEAQLN